jgi:transposase-like protein
MTNEEIKQLVESNARAIQALTDTISTFADRVSEAIQQAQTEREELRQATIGIANLLADLDQARPTILR